MREVLGIIFVVLLSIGSIGLLNLILNLFINFGRLRLSHAFYEGLALLAIIFSFLEKTHFSIALFSSPITLTLLTLLSAVGFLYLLQNVKRKFNPYYFAEFLFILIFYFHYFVVYSEYPLRDIFQDIHFYKGALEFSTDSVLNLMTANSYIPIFQTTFGLSHKIIPFDMIKASWLTPFVFSFFGIIATHSFFKAITRVDVIAFFCTTSFILSAPKTFLSQTNNNLLYFYIFILVSEIITNSSKWPQNFIRLIFIGRSIHRAAILLIPTILPFYFIRKSRFSIKLRALASKINSKILLIFFGLTVIHFLLWAYLNFYKPTYYYKMITIINSAMNFILNKDYLYEIVHRGASNVYSFPNLVIEWIREFSPAYCVFAVVLFFIWISDSNLFKSKFIKLIAALAFPLVNLMIFLPVPNLGRGRMAVTLLLIIFSSLLFIKLKATTKRSLSTFLTIFFCILAAWKYDFTSNIYTQSYYTFFIVFCIISLIIVIYNWHQSSAKLSILLIISVLVFDKMLITSFFFNYSYGDSAFYNTYRNLNAVSHYTKEMYRISELLPRNNNTILMSDPSTMAIVKARTGYNSFVSFENIGGGTDKFAESQYKNYLRAQLLNKNHYPFLEVDLFYFVKFPQVINQEAYYSFTKKKISWSEENINRNAVFIITPQTINWLDIASDSDGQQTYYPYMKNTHIPLGLPINTEIIHKSESLLIFKKL